MSRATAAGGKPPTATAHASVCGLGLGLSLRTQRLGVLEQCAAHAAPRLELLLDLRDAEAGLWWVS